MKLPVIISSTVFIASSTLAAGDTISHLTSDVFSTLLYSFLGIAMAITAYKIIDWVTPGDLDKEIIDEHNVAASVIVGSMILGICIIIASVMAH